MRVNIKYLSISCLIIPILTVVISYIFSIKFNLVPSCIPNLDGCTSISRVGRYEPVKFFFKPLMFLYGIILFYYWRENYLIMKKNKIKKIILFYMMGILSIIFLFLYIIFLGEGEIYRFFRKIGIYIFIFFMVISQFLLSKKYNELIKINKKNLNINFIKIKLFYSSTLLLIGIILLPILLIKIENYPEIKNIISWNYFLLLQVYFLNDYLSWK